MTVSQGGFSAEDGTLNPLLDGIWSVIYRSSNVAIGTWSFDAYFTVFGGGEVDFMLTMENYGFELEMPAANMLQLYRMAGEDQVRLIQYFFPRSLSGWQHFDITRDLDGRLCIYHNGTLVIDTVDTTVSESQFFVYITSRFGQAIDNIVVSNTVDLLPPSPVPFYMQTWFSAAVAAVIVAVVIIVAYVELRKG